MRFRRFVQIDTSIRYHYKAYGKKDNPENTSKTLSIPKTHSPKSHYPDSFSLDGKVTAKQPERNRRSNETHNLTDTCLHTISSRDGQKREHRERTVILGYTIFPKDATEEFLHRYCIFKFTTEEQYQVMNNWHNNNPQPKTA